MGFSSTLGFSFVVKFVLKRSKDILHLPLKIQSFPILSCFNSAFELKHLLILFISSIDSPNTS